CVRGRYYSGNFSYGRYFDYW
nr:immunoglobulin heavy chain junction region [Macaca mulatta]MOX95612.1 immunoglobulin heavy chain junction region [Macaca mulatta]MOX96131.1 immunoglobulin heavy chain junction region [Macaca mulatta]